MSFGMQKEKSSASSEMNSNQNVWGGQSPFLESLYNSAQGLFNQQQGPVWANSTGLAQEGLAAGRQGIGSMQDIARTGGPVGQYAQPNNALASQQLAAMSGDIGQNLQRNVMPALNSQAGLAGGMGGSRNAIGRGLAASDAQSQIANAGTNLYAQQYGIGAQAAGAATQARMDAAGQLPGMGASQYNLGMSPFTAMWAPMTALASMIGSPTALTTASSTSQQSGKKSGFNFGLF